VYANGKEDLSERSGGPRGAKDALRSGHTSRAGRSRWTRWPWRHDRLREDRRRHGDRQDRRKQRRGGSESGDERPAADADGLYGLGYGRLEQIALGEVLQAQAHKLGVGGQIGARRQLAGDVSH
jgi:hypothetical protein